MIGVGDTDGDCWLVQGSAPDCDGSETNESDALAPLYSDGGLGVGDSDSVHVEEEIGIWTDEGVIFNFD